MSGLLSLQGVRMTVGLAPHTSQLLHGVDLTVEAGQAVGIVGESGSGKTLTVRSIVGLTPAHSTISGSIQLDGREVTTMNDRDLMRMRREDVGMVFQDPHSAINPVHRIDDFLTETFLRGTRQERRDAERRAVSLLGEVRIKNPERVMRQYPHELSGGMLQRVMIASVLMRSPRLILADEPTTALDVTTQADVVALLDELRRERGAALVFISHDIELVAALCDRILVMYKGRVIEDLTVSALRDGDIKEPYTQSLLDCRPDVTERKDRLPVTDPASFAERYARS